MSPLKAKRSAHPVKPPLTMSVTFRTTTPTGYEVDWTVTVSPASGGLDEVMTRVALGFAPRPGIADFLRRHEAEWDAAPNRRLFKTFTVEGFDCQLKGDYRGWELVWEPTAAAGEPTSQPRVTRQLRRTGGGTAGIGEAAIIGAEPPILANENGSGWLHGNERWTPVLVWGRPGSDPTK